MASLLIQLTTLLIVLALSTSHPLDATQEETLSKPDALQIQGETAPHKGENQRSKRQYYYPSWATNAIVQGYSIWQPQYLQIRRPYFIPVWGASGRIPVYLPPQPLYINSGYPHINPPKRYPGLPYLPPDRPITEPPTTNETTTKDLENKFDIDGVPVWDEVTGSSTTVRPTRRTKRPGQQSTTAPPLVHKNTPSIPDTVEKSAVSPIGNLRPNTGGSVRPAKPQNTQPQSPNEPPVLSGQPSRCVWAIISCCSANSQTVSYSCFEQLGCTGAFWDKSPCESEFARSAISSAMNYYNTK